METDNKTEAVLEEMSKRELGEVKVLMVEDDEFMTELVATKLSTSGCIPYSAKSAEEAKELALQYQPDAIILDLMLPGIQGEDLLKDFKADENLAHIPVIVFSNKDSKSDIDNLLSLGAVEYLIKSSTDLGVLVEIVKKYSS